VQLDPFFYLEDKNTLTRYHRLGDASIIYLEMKPDEYEDIVATIEGISTLSSATEYDVEQVISQIFNLRIDLGEFYSIANNHEGYEWIAPSGAGRLMRCPTVWEDLVKILMTTNTSWAMTKGMVSRINALGQQYDEQHSAFPTPERLASMTFDQLSEEVRAGYRTEYLYELAQKITSGELDVEAWNTSELPSEDLYKEITNLKGFGPYAGASMLKLLGRFDKLAIDTAARTMFVQKFEHDDQVTDRMIRKHYETFGQWAGLFLWMDVLRMYTEE